jgi:hypothetical protein
LGIASELAQVLEGLKKGLLNRVLGIFPVMRDVLGDSKEFAIVPLYEFLEGSNIPVLAGMDQLQVIACSGTHCELSRGCSHIHSPRFGEQSLCGSNSCQKLKNRSRCPSIESFESYFTTTVPVIFGCTEQ